jgi:hypothetical protein
LPATQTQLFSLSIWLCFCPTRLRLPGTFHRPEWMSRYCEVALSRHLIPTQMFVVVQNST